MDDSFYHDRRNHLNKYVLPFRIIKASENSHADGFEPELPSFIAVLLLYATFPTWPGPSTSILLTMLPSLATRDTSKRTYHPEETGRKTWIRMRPPLHDQKAQIQHPRTTLQMSGSRSKACKRSPMNKSHYWKTSSKR